MATHHSTGHLLPRALLSLALLLYRVSSNENAGDSESYPVAHNGAKVSLVKDIWYGPDGSKPSDFVDVPSLEKIFFLANDGEHGHEPWVSDGTEDGTVMLADVNPGVDSGNVLDPFEHEGRVFFSANDGSAGQELWVTDLTPGGTALVRDIVYGPVGSWPIEFVEFRDELYFVAGSPANGGAQLWKTDGTEGGTVLVMDFSAVAPGEPDRQVSCGLGTADGQGLLYLALRDGNGALVRSDGTPSMESRSCSGSPPDDVRCELTGTVVIKFGIDARIPPRAPVVDGRMIFRTSGGELWSTDGTAEGTVPLLTGLRVRRVSRDAVGGGRRVLFAAESLEWLFSTDGTPEGTAPISPPDGTPFTYRADVEEQFGVSGYGNVSLFEGSVSVGPVFSNNRQLFMVNGVSSGVSSSTTIWLSDGTSSGTEFIKDLGTVEPSAGDRTPDGDRFFIGMFPPQTWVTDGTVGGTQMLVDFGSDGYEYREDGSVRVLSDDVILLNGGRKKEGIELWRLDLPGNIESEIATEEGGDMQGTENGAAAEQKCGHT